jgi:putative ABC transport system substrate-binding protein
MRRRFLAQLSGAAALLAAGRMPASIAQGAKRFRIYAVTWRGKTQVESGLEDYFGKQGIAVEFIWRDAEQQTARLAGFVQEIKALRPDLVYTWGTPPTLGIAGAHDAVDTSRHVTGIPIVFALVAAPVAAKVVPSLTAPGRDITGVTHVATLESQLEAIRTYRPFSRLGVLYNAAERNSVATAEGLRQLAASQRFQLIEQVSIATPTARRSPPAWKKNPQHEAGRRRVAVSRPRYLFSQIERGQRGDGAAPADLFGDRGRAERQGTGARRTGVELLHHRPVRRLADPSGYRTRGAGRGFCRGDRHLLRLLPGAQGVATAAD